MKTKKIIALLASCSLIASSFMALCTTAFAADKPTFTIECTPVNDFTGEYADYAKKYDWSKHEEDGVKFQTYHIAVKASGVELETKLVGRASEFEGTSIASATLETKVETEATKNDYLFGAVKTLAPSYTGMYSSTDPTLYTAIFSDSNPLYPTSDVELKVNKDDSFTVFEYMFTIDTSKTCSLTFKNSQLVYSTFYTNASGSVMKDGSIPAVSLTPVIENATLTFGKTKPVINVKPEKAEMILGNTVELTPNNDQKVELAYKYESSSPEVATVDDKGVVTAVGVGTATITVSAEGATSAECAINVRKATVGEDFTPTKLGKKIKFIGMPSLKADNSNQNVYITKDGVTKMYDKTIGEILGGVWGEDTSVEASLAIGIITADESSVFSFEIR